MNLCDLFDLSLLGRRDAVALEFREQTFTFAEIDGRSNRLARLFESRGMRAGDRLCVYLANCVEMIDIFLACVKLGVIFVPINILYRDREISHILEDAEPRAVVSDVEIATDIPAWTAAGCTRRGAKHRACRRRSTWHSARVRAARGR